MSDKHYTIPVFIPELACPFQCVFCNQKKITGHIHIPDKEEIRETIVTYLASFKQSNRIVEVGFFGGSFTGIPLDQQKQYLEIVQPFLKSAEVKGIRLSTRPDYINKEKLKLLADYGVTTIELGAQSFDDEVLRKSMRGHTVRQVVEASKLINSFNINLGLQIMTGLPGDTVEKTINSALKVVELNAVDTRIYPVVIIKDTALHQWYKTGKYNPLQLHEAVDRVKKIIPIFEKHNVNIIRVGLHPSEGLLSGDELIAGPFHPGFRELVYTEIWNDILRNITHVSFDKIEIHIAEKEINYAIGYKSKNKRLLESRFKLVKFVTDKNIKNRDFVIKNLL